ncbi:MAG: formyltetrahydrofolate deformylase [Gammaproteobacteria bacterium]
MKDKERYVLRVSCPERMGLIAAITGFLADQKCFITELLQFDDFRAERFFCRVEFSKPESGIPLNDLSDLFSKVGAVFEMDWIFINPSIPVRTLILVSKFDHCLNDILYRQQTGELNIDVTTVASNHPDLESLARFHKAPFEVLPTGKSKLETKVAQEDRIRQLIDEHNVDLVVLARYMQVLSDELCQDLAGRCINIHHSFLPSFKGARPYHQAYERGVKAIGATAHYVSADLDEGPIIDQEVVRVDHTFGPDQLLTMGRNAENLALARAMKVHSEYRVFLNGNKTVVLK